jgi:hypothetical protein
MIKLIPNKFDNDEKNNVPFSNILDTTYKFNIPYICDYDKFLKIVEKYKDCFSDLSKLITQEKIVCNVYSHRIFTATLLYYQKLEYGLTLSSPVIGYSKYFKTKDYGTIINIIKDIVNECIISIDKVELDNIIKEYKDKKDELKIQYDKIKQEYNDYESYTNILREHLYDKITINN